MRSFKGLVSVGSIAPKLLRRKVYKYSGGPRILGLWVPLKHYFSAPTLSNPNEATVLNRECVSMGATGAQTHRSPFAPTDFEAFSTIETHGF